MGWDPLPQILKEPKSLYHSPSGTSGRVSTQRRGRLRSEMLIARSRVRSIRCRRTPWEACPKVRAAALAAEHRSAEFIAPAVSRQGILLVPKTLGEGKKVVSGTMNTPSPICGVPLLRGLTFNRTAALGSRPVLVLPAEGVTRKPSARRPGFSAKSNAATRMPLRTATSCSCGSSGTDSS